MKRLPACTLGWLVFTQLSHAVELVHNGAPISEIVIAKTPHQGTKTAAEELQRRIEQISGAQVPIVNVVSANVPNQIYVGESEMTQHLGVSSDDIQSDGYKVVVGEHHVVLLGKDIYHSDTTFGKYKDRQSRLTQQDWEKLTGHKWRTPSFYPENDYNRDCGFHIQDGTGTLYAVYDLLEQLGLRWYMPVPEIGVVIPHLKTISVKPQSLKKEPEFPQRIFHNGTRGAFKDEMLWYKSMKVGTSFVLPLYHAVGRLTYFGKEADPAYFGQIAGKPNYQSPKLTSEKLRADFVDSLRYTRQVYPGIAYDSLGQPDGWSLIDSADAAAGWNKTERGTYGCFTDYLWDFNMDVRKRVMAEDPTRKFTVMAYSGTTLPPTNPQKIPDNVTVGILQHNSMWMSAPSNRDLALRNEWLERMSDGKQQLLILDHYLEHAPIRATPPVPVIFTKFLIENLKGAYDRSVGYDVEVPWVTSTEYANTKATSSLRKPGLSHLMIYLHAKLEWNRHLDIQTELNEYYSLFFGPAEKEMREFYEFAESVWCRSEPHEVSANGGFLKPADVEKYFEILGRAKTKAGDSIFGKRIDLITSEMEPLHGLFDNLQRTGGAITGYYARHKHQIDGDLEKPFWKETEDRVTTPLRNLTTGNLPNHLTTNVAFRWLQDDSALVVGIECFEPKMPKIRATCRERDSLAIFADDNVEIRLETAQGIRPLIVVNSEGVVLDECITGKSEDLPSFYTVKDIAVKKLADRWTVEALIEVKPIEGQRPTTTYPWGVNICRQRLAGNTPEFYMLFPSGTKFNDLKAMGNLTIRH
ncbi:MAG: DUF4838 domain-containing protein [Verrucomicrobiota bacterium]